MTIVEAARLPDVEPRRRLRPRPHPPAGRRSRRQLIEPAAVAAAAATGDSAGRRPRLPPPDAGPGRPAAAGRLRADRRPARAAARGSSSCPTPAGWPRRWRRSSADRGVEVLHRRPGGRARRRRRPGRGVAGRRAGRGPATRWPPSTTSRRSPTSTSTSGAKACSRASSCSPPNAARCYDRAWMRAGSFLVDARPATAAPMATTSEVPGARWPAP